MGGHEWIHGITDQAFRKVEIRCFPQVHSYPIHYHLGIVGSQSTHQYIVATLQNGYLGVFSQVVFGSGYFLLAVIQIIN